MISAFSTRRILHIACSSNSLVYNYKKHFKTYNFWRMRKLNNSNCFVWTCPWNDMTSFWILIKITLGNEKKISQSWENYYRRKDFLLVWCEFPLQIRDPICWNSELPERDERPSISLSKRSTKRNSRIIVAVYLHRYRIFREQNGRFAFRWNVFRNKVTQPDSGNIYPPWISYCDIVKLNGYFRNIGW